MVILKIWKITEQEKLGLVPPPQHKIAIGAGKVILEDKSEIIKFQAFAGPYVLFYVESISTLSTLPYLSTH